MGPVTRYAPSRDGYLAYQVLGEGPVDLLVIAELLSHCEHRWDEPTLSRCLQRLAETCRVVMFDKRGTGLSDPVSPGALPTLEERAQDVAAVLDAARSSRCALAGFSEGGVDAMFFAATRPNRVSSLALYGAWPCFFATDGYPVGWQREQFEPLIETVLTSWGQGLLLPLIAPSTRGDDRLLSWWASYERLAASPSIAAAFLRIAIDVDMRNVLSSISAPTVVIHRSDDVFSPVDHGRYLAAHIPDATLIEIPGRDHPFFIGNPDSIIDAITEHITGARPRPAYDRVLATAMFVDIVGSTDRAAAIGDRAWSDLLEAYYRLVRTHLDRHDGREIDTAGDGLLAAFDGPGRAVACGCAIRDGVHSLGLRVRAGLHAGECQLIAGKITGLAVHIAARVAAMAEPDEVLVSRTIKDLAAGSNIGFADRGTHALKGVPESWQLYAAAM
jgi:class 3 adenylate cyclase/alpha-beta hydrolase superfamily lysophospholipase